MSRWTLTALFGTVVGVAWALPAFAQTVKATPFGVCTAGC